MALLERLQAEMVGAMKAKDELRLSTLRMMKTALKKHEVDSMKPLDEPSEMQILNMLIKQRREAAEMFRKGDRQELARERRSRTQDDRGVLAGCSERGGIEPGRIRGNCGIRRYVGERYG